MAFAALMSLSTTIRDLVFSSHISLSPTSLPILSLAFEALRSLLEILQRLDGSSKSCSRKNVNALDERIKEAIWKFEDLLDSHLYHQIFPQSQILGGGAILEVQLDELIHDFESFIKMLEELEKEYMYELDHLSPEEEDVVVDVDVVALASADSGVKNCKMVGSFYYLWAHIRRQMEMKSSFDVISLVGMGGIGKTALAKELFNDPLDFTGFEFECRAWVTIGRKWQPDKLIRDILSQLDPISEGVEEILKAKRCLIVLDDVWDNELWDHFQRSFPTHIFGTTLVLLTTRLQHVVRYARVRRYTVQLLNDDESWDLLRQRVFGEKDSCPPELEKAGKEIAEECDGLPLMILTVADLLREHEMTVEYWESIAKKKNSAIFMTAYDRLYEVLFPSYEYLPQHLKPCFLYMGVTLKLGRSLHPGYLTCG